MSLIISASAFGSIAREVEYVDHMKNRHLEKVGKHFCFRKELVFFFCPQKICKDMGVGILEGMNEM